MVFHADKARINNLSFNDIDNTLNKQWNTIWPQMLEWANVKSETRLKKTRYLKEVLPFRLSWRIGGHDRGIFYTR